MRRIAVSVRKDLLRTLRRPLGTLLLLAFPLAFAGVIAMTFGTSGDVSIRVPVLVENQDDGFASTFLLGALGSEQMAQHFAIEAVASGGAARMERGEASALLVIPAGFTDDLLGGRPVKLRLVRNPSERIRPEIAEQMTRVLADVLDAGSYALRAPLEELSGMLDTEGGTAAAVGALAASFHRALGAGAEYVFPPVIELEVATAEGEGDEPSQGSSSPFLWMLPGASVFALFLIGDLSMRDVLVEAQAGTLRRQLAGPLGPGTVLAAKAAHTALLSAISIAILSVAGAFAVRGGIDGVAFVVLSLSLVLLVTGTASFVYGAARSQRQGATVAAAVYLFLAFLGGSFFPVESLPAALRGIATFTPFHWATDGYVELIRRGGGLREVAANAVSLALTGAILLLAGSRLLRWRLVHGWLT
jgi:ABC-2 type transport system permease protein